MTAQGLEARTGPLDREPPDRCPPNCPHCLASANDREWFKERSHRRFRLRERLRGEFPTSDTHVLVEQLEPGFRYRQTCSFIDVLPPDTDEALARIEDLLVKGKVAVVQEGQITDFADYTLGYSA